MNRSTILAAAALAATLVPATAENAPSRVQSDRESTYRFILPPQTKTDALLMQEDAGEIRTASETLSDQAWTCGLAFDVTHYSNGGLSARDRKSDVAFVQGLTFQWSGTLGASGIGLDLGGQAVNSLFAHEPNRNYAGTEGGLALHLPWIGRSLGAAGRGLDHSLVATAGYYGNTESGRRLMTFAEFKHIVSWTFEFNAGNTRITPGTTITWLRSAPDYYQKTVSEVWLNGEQRVLGDWFLLGGYRLGWHDSHDTDRGEVRHTADAALEWRPTRTLSARLSTGWENNTDRAAGRTSYVNWSTTLGVALNFSF